MNFLLLGASGFAGRHLYSFLKSEKVNVKGTHYKNQSNDTVFFDSTNNNLNNLIEGECFNVGFILLGETNIEPCYNDKTYSDILNVDSIINVLQIMKLKKIKPIFISSEYVFKDINGFKSEDDDCVPETVYGKQKLKMEKYINSNFDKYLIIRSPKVIGHTLGDGTLLSNWIDQLRNKETIKCAIDQYFCATSIDDIVECYYKAAKEHLNGIYNICSKISYNRKEMLEILSDIINIKPNIKEVLINDFKFSEKRPLDLSMNSDKFTNIIPHRFQRIDESCEKLGKQLYKISNK